MEYLFLLEQLYRNDVRYLLCGGLAVNMYGIPRMTADIDIILDLEALNISKFVKIATQCGYVSRYPLPITQLIDKAEKQRLLIEKNLIAYSYYHTANAFMELDVLLDVPLSFDDLWKNRETRDAGTFEVMVVSLSDLIALKMYANRIQDQQDVLLLSKILKNG